MSDLDALQERRGREPFRVWEDGPVTAERVAAANAAYHQLLGDFIAFGPSPAEADARAAVDACVRRFNALDDGWIMTIERDDIAEILWDVIERAGFEGEANWLDEREW